VVCNIFLFKCSHLSQKINFINFLLMSTNPWKFKSHARYHIIFGWSTDYLPWSFGFYVHWHIPCKQKLKARRTTVSVLLNQAQQLCLHILFLSVPWSGMSNEIKVAINFVKIVCALHSTDWRDGCWSTLAPLSIYGLLCFLQFIAWTMFMNSK